MFQHTAARRRLRKSQQIKLVELVSTHSRPKAAGKISVILNLFMTFQHTAARRRLIYYKLIYEIFILFQHTAARRRLIFQSKSKSFLFQFQHTAARRRLKSFRFVFGFDMCFNTQPPEGGWCARWFAMLSVNCFNTQPPEGGWAMANGFTTPFNVSTHSRPKAAGRWSW